MPGIDMNAVRNQGDGGEQRLPTWWKTRSGAVLCGFLLVAGFYLVTEHTAHVFGVLPYLLILACPLMHLFHHHGHGGHGAHHDASAPPGETGPERGKTP